MLPIRRSAVIPICWVKGDEGEAVQALQERLRVAGFYYGNSTGIYGPITEDAVKRFQRAYGLDVDGIVGAQTLTKLPPMGVGFGDEEAPKSMTIAATRRKQRISRFGRSWRTCKNITSTINQSRISKGTTKWLFRSVYK